MIPKVNNRGHGFKGVAAYLMHDKESDTAERVEWTQTGNLHTDDIKKAALIMAWTDKNAEALKQSSGGSLAGRKPEVGGVYHYSLSWSQDEEPSREHMQAQALETLKRLGLEKHQYFIIAHNDTEHTHLHVVSNLTNPETGQRLTPSFDKKELQSWALEYEREHGIKCKMREENAAKREQGEFVKSRDSKQDYSQRVTRAFYAADNGKAFVHSLEHEGLHLARGRRGGFVIVDETGDIQKLGRQLDIEPKGKQKSAAIKSFLADVDGDTLADADRLATQIKQANEEHCKILVVANYRALRELDQDYHQAAEKRQAEIYEKERIKILKAAKADWAELKINQKQERHDLETRLRDTDSRKEAAHRKHWQGIIDKDEALKVKLEETRDFSWLGSLIYKVQNKQSVQDAINDRELNIRSSEARLQEGVGGLNRSDKYQLKKLGDSHAEQREELRNHIDGSLLDAQEKSHQQAQQEQEMALINEALANDESATRLDNVVSGKTIAQKRKVEEIKTRAKTYRDKEITQKQEIEESYQVQMQQQEQQANDNRILQPTQNKHLEQDENARKAERLQVDFRGVQPSREEKIEASKEVFRLRAEQEKAARSQSRNASNLTEEQRQNAPTPEKPDYAPDRELSREERIEIKKQEYQQRLELQNSEIQPDEPRHDRSLERE